MLQAKHFALEDDKISDKVWNNKIRNSSSSRPLPEGTREIIGLVAGDGWF